MRVNVLLPILAYLSSVASAQTYADPPPAFHQCTKTLTYQLFFNNLKIGQMTRVLRWQNKQAQINSYSNIEVLATKTRFNQQSQVYWSEQQQSFLSKGFRREVNGLLGGKSDVSFSKDGTSSKVNVDGKVSSFSSDSLPLLDVDAIGSQMRLGLIEGKARFEYKLQDTDDVNRYHFQVMGKERLNSNFGSINTIRVEQIKKNDRKLVMWFSPDVDYQLVRATYKRKILDLKAVLLSNKKVCPPTSQFSQASTPNRP
ncbi:hypothetical protein RJ45_13460 [Photobacterium gaetbulicola]|uniref:DUF3108 domain-containing protein n=1 Tax=Photobacterium gaetbulicola TaxID=1295392 RepID=A0A0B9GXC1_9GAMM|nr:DUF3108 domain-containing protein [Photobacterium gaetbulicola]KHT63381.1 hypothetical protein RJ45_13460 [Photobacterium gaetbulicola]